MWQMNYRKITAASFVIAVAGIVVPLCSMNLFSWLFELPPTEIWKWTPMMPLSSFSIEWWIILFLGNFLLAFSVVFLYALFYRSIPGTGIRKGLMMGLLLYPLGILFPAFNLYELTTLNMTVLLYLLLEGFAEFLFYGAIAGLIYKV
jgi:hypothetical protein